MSSELDLDLVLAAWVRQAVTRPAPRAAITAALAEIEVTAQRRPIRVRGLTIPDGTRTWPPATRPLLATGLMLALGLVVTISGAFDSILVGPSASPAPPTSQPSATPQLSGAPRGHYLMFDDVDLLVWLPVSWRTLEEGPTLVRVAGDEPAGTLAVSYAADGFVSVCDPECETIAIPGYLPLSPEQSLVAARTQLYSRLGGGTWRPATDMSSNLVLARRLDLPADGGRPLRSYVVGGYLTTVMVISMTATGDGAAALVDSMLRSIRPSPPLSAPRGAGIVQGVVDQGVAIEVPDLWLADVNTFVAGATTFGYGRMSIGTTAADGLLPVCDPFCVRLDPSDLAALEATVFAPADQDVVRGDTVIGGEPARYELVRRGDSAWYRAIGLVDGAVIHVWIDL